MKDYPKLAMRTNKPGDEITLYEGQLSILIPALKVLTMASQNLDALKASICYGRGLPESAGLQVPMSGRDKEIIHAILGLITEGGELAETLLAELETGNPNELNLANMNLVEEGGDLCWFQELMAHAIGVPVKTWKISNIRKLKARFPDKYSDDQANSRDKDAEEAALK